MKKALYICAAAAVAAFVLAQGEGVTALAKITKALNGAQGLKATYSVQAVGGSPTSYAVELAKPNLAKIDTATQLVVADGAKITTYDKVKKTYYGLPQTPKALKKALNDVGAGIWYGFFDPKADAGASNVRLLPNVTRRGMNLSTVQFNRLEGVPTTITYYFASDSIPRQAEVVSGAKGKEETTIVNSSSLQVLGKADPASFAFKAPEGSRELSASEMDAGRWYTNFDEALAAAKATNRLVLVDFYTGWCHWCKVLRAEVYPKDEFKAMSKYFVFCEIDAEAETSLAARYSVNAYPTSVFVDGDGNQVHRLEGYKPLDGYLAEMNTALQKAGK